MKFQSCQILAFNWPQKHMQTDTRRHTHTHMRAHKHRVRPQTLRSMQPGPNVCMGIGPKCMCVCALMESQRVIGIEVTDVNKERKALKAEKCTQGALEGQFLTF